MKRRQPTAGASPGALPRNSWGPSLRPLLQTFLAAHPGADVQLIERAYEVAAYCHFGQRRRNGDPYISHPLAVARIVAELGMSREAVCAALLHDIIEDTPCPLTLLRHEFGDEIAALVDRVSRPDEVRQQAEAALRLNTNCRVGPLLRDTEVLVLKLADRLHNMRTMRCLPRTTQELKSRETLELHAPLAHLLGMDTVQRELEELASTILHGKMYDTRTCMVSQRALATMIVMLPSETRARWLEEWTGELFVLPTRRARARFVVQMLRGMPHLAVTLRRPVPGNAQS